MSHFTNVKTHFQNLFYLRKALNKFNIVHEEKNFTNSGIEPTNVNLLIPQSNGHNIEFAWNGQEYQLVVDLSYWEQPYCVESFIAKIAQQYASETIIGESRKTGFQPVKYYSNNDGSNTIILERWNNEK